VRQTTDDISNSTD